MSGKLGTELVIAVADIVTAGALGKLMRIRATLARDKLFERMSSGDVKISDAADVDEAAAIIHKYMTCSLLGAANENMDLLADLAAGRLKTAPVRSLDYPHWADLVTGLSAQELLFLGSLFAAFEGMNFEDTKIGRSEAADVARSFATQMTSGSVSFASAEDFHVTGLALTRTGLIRPISLISDVNLYRPSTKLQELVRMARLGRDIAFNGPIKQ